MHSGEILAEHRYLRFVLLSSLSTVHDGNAVTTRHCMSTFRSLLDIFVSFVRPSTGAARASGVLLNGMLSVSRDRCRTFSQVPDGRVREAFEVDLFSGKVTRKHPPRLFSNKLLLQDVRPLPHKEDDDRASCSWDLHRIHSLSSENGREATHPNCFDDIGTLDDFFR